MKDELSNLESLIFGNLLSDANEHSSDKAESLFMSFQSEKDTIKQNIALSAFRLKKKPLRHYIRHHQVRLISLYDLLSADISDNVPDKCKTNLRQVVISIVDELLQFIELHFPEYFNSDADMPLNLRIAAIAEFNRAISEIERHKLFSANPILTVILVPVKEYAEDTAKALSFHLSSYFRLLLLEIMNVCSVPAISDLRLAITSRLIYINFNYLVLYNYLADTIRTEIQNEEIINDRIDRLSWYLKVVNQSAVKTETSYNPKQKPMKELLSSWLLEELGYIERQVQPVQPVNHILSGNNQMFFKLPLDMSVPQLACFIRIMYDTGVIKSKNVRQIMNFFAANTHTRRTETISNEKLRIKFYDINQSTIDDVRLMVLDLLNRINAMK